MPFHRQSRDRSVIAFLETSRIHFDLNPPRRPARPHTTLRSLLVAGSLGALFGGPALADTALDTVRDFELRPGASIAAQLAEPASLSQLQK
ncbi:hypothetical protein [Dechloromonas sp. H13]|uniref:hypothetical protein n=1 Tax=Dechloromonas sp. H13 TaxID=2570193 RepID=UPI0012924A96|nr:hypothetical protein [Dechloromonas sp. H13]